MLICNFKEKIFSDVEKLIFMPPLFLLFSSSYCPIFATSSVLGPRHLFPPPTVGHCSHSLPIYFSLSPGSPILIVSFEEMLYFFQLLFSRSLACPSQFFPGSILVMLAYTTTKTIQIFKKA